MLRLLALLGLFLAGTAYADGDYNPSALSSQASPQNYDYALKPNSAQPGPGSLATLPSSTGITWLNGTLGLAPAFLDAEGHINAQYAPVASTMTGNGDSYVCVNAQGQYFRKDAPCK